MERWSCALGLRLAVLAALVTGVVLIYWSSFASLTSVWATQNYRHGYLIPLISAWLIWDAREQLVEAPWRPSWWGLLALGLLVWAWAVSRAALVQAGEHLALVLMVNAAVFAVAGSAVYRRIAFPMLYLLFVVPIGESLVPFLMQATAEIAESCLSLVGVLVYREGQILTLPGGTFRVADVCSGMSYLLAAVALSSVVAYRLFRSNVRRVLFVAAVGVVFVAANGVRAFLVMLIASASDMRYLTGYDHIVFGWVIFMMVGAGMCWLALRASDLGAAHED